MARMPLAKWLGPVPYNSGDGDRTPMEPEDAITAYWYVVIHIADGSYDGTNSWQHNDSANVSSHFIVAKDGRISQLVDTHDRAWTQIKGNPRSISIENEGFTGQALTPEQVEGNAQIFAWAHATHGIPLQVTGTPDLKGLGHHSMGAENGVDWGHSACPGARIKAQKPAILARAIEIVNGDNDMLVNETAWLYNASSISASLARMSDTAPIKTDTGKPGEPVKLELVTAVKAIGSAVAALSEKVDSIGDVVITDEQLERVIRRVLGMAPNTPIK